MLYSSDLLKLVDQGLKEEAIQICIIQNKTTRENAEEYIEALILNKEKIQNKSKLHKNYKYIYYLIIIIVCIIIGFVKIVSSFGVFPVLITIGVCLHFCRMLFGGKVSKGIYTGRGYKGRY